MRSIARFLSLPPKDFLQHRDGGGGAFPGEPPPLLSTSLPPERFAAAKTINDEGEDDDDEGRGRRRTSRTPSSDLDKVGGIGGIGGGGDSPRDQNGVAKERPKNLPAAFTSLNGRAAAAGGGGRRRVGNLRGATGEKVRSSVESSNEPQIFCKEIFGY